ncbi:MAG: 30S ribosomal protein S15 [Elusimicrobia bacterium]|nr:30S ribosomal protein S15 [Elusimicrobiota bacterium]
MITKENKAEIIKKFGKHPADTGGAPAQVALLTERIKQISAHLKNNKKDHLTESGLLKLVSQRRMLLSYLKQRDRDSYNQVIKALELRK